MASESASEHSGEWPALDLPIHPPVEPMEARLVRELPGGEGWVFEPKWDGFRCLAFKQGRQVALQSKAGQPLARYFPELVEAVRELGANRCVIDGEIVIPSGDGLSFDDLLQRIHPAESRIRLLSARTPARLIAFDLLVDARGEDLTSLPLVERRAALEDFATRCFEGSGRFDLSPSSGDRNQVERWRTTLRGKGIDGVMAKRADLPYRAGERDGMVKVKWLRTADCVVGGFRYAQARKVVGSLLLGLYDEEGLLHHVGFCSTFPSAERVELTRRLEAMVRPPGFTGRAPGGPSRWSQGRSTEWQPLEPSLVVEVTFDHSSGGRFRHGTGFLRWRPDKRPDQCTMEQMG